MNVPARPLSTETVFSTSGHTGGARRWWRTDQQLEREVDMVADTLVDPVRTIRQVVSFAPPQHLFGHLFGQILPRRRRLPVFEAWRYSPAEVLAGMEEHALILTVPHAWELLRRAGDHARALRSAVALHSTAAPPAAAAEVLARWGPGGFTAHEILGSTETGAIAHRPLARDADVEAPWTPFADVELLDGSPDTDRPLRVRSPRLARRDDADAPPEDHDTGDLICNDGRGGFLLRGRASRIVKVNGRRTDLAEIEAGLAGQLPNLEIACVRVTDPLRGEHLSCATATTPGPLHRSSFPGAGASTNTRSLEKSVASHASPVPPVARSTPVSSAVSPV